MRRIILSGSIIFLAIAAFAYLDGRLGRTLCRYYKEGWLETKGVVECYRAP